MGAGYQLAYRLGVTPWERAGELAHEAIARLLDRESLGRPEPLGRALDVGCGIGTHTRELQARGWEATGIDNVRYAIDRAIARGEDECRFFVGDAAHLKGSGIGVDFSFVLDVGCFHGLGEEERRLYGEGLSSVTTPDATMLILAIGKNSMRPLPRGADRAAVEAALPDWTLVSVEPADPSSLPHLLRHTEPRWYRLRRR